MKTILLFLAILAPFLKAGSRTSIGEESLFTARNMRCIAHNQLIGDINTAKSLVQLRTAFVRKVKLWEQVHNRPMTKRDLVQPYLVNDQSKGIYEVRLKTISTLSNFISRIEILSSAEQEYWKTLFYGAKEWRILSKLFSFPAVALSKSPTYEELFGLQILVEYARCTGEGVGYANRKDIYTDPISFELYDPNFEISDNQRRTIKNKLKLYTKEVVLGRKGFFEYHLRNLELIGTVADAPEIQESIAHKFRRWLHREPAPAAPLLELPVSPPEQGWRYLHEVPGKGFSIFMHVFPDLRDEIADFDAYGMAISPEIIASLQTFHPPGYLPLMATPVQNPMVRVPGTVSEDISVSGATTAESGSTTVASGALEEIIGSRSSAGAGSGAPPSSTISLTTSSTFSTAPQGITANAIEGGEVSNAATNLSETEIGIRRKVIISSMLATATEDPLPPLLSSQGKYT